MEEDLLGMTCGELPSLEMLVLLISDLRAEESTVGIKRTSSASSVSAKTQQKLQNAAFSNIF